MAGGVSNGPAFAVQITVEPNEKVVVGDEAGRDKQGIPTDGPAVRHCHPAEVVVFDPDLLYLAFDDSDGAGNKLGTLQGCQGTGRGKEDDIFGPLPDDLGETDSVRCPAQNPELLVLNLISVTVRAVQDIPGPPVPKTWNPGQHIAQTRGQKQPAGRYPPSVSQQEPEACWPARHKFCDGTLAYLSSVAANFLPPCRQQIPGGQPVAGKEPVHVRCRGVPRISGIDHQDLASGPGKHQGCGQSGGSAADYNYVKFLHAFKALRVSQYRQQTLLIPGKRRLVGPVKQASVPVAAALGQVGSRLKRLRTYRGVTLMALAAATGISKSTLSRLESGQRRPSLELLLPLAEAYNVPLDDLVGAPEVGDPRVRLKPKGSNGRTVIPLTRQPGGMQAAKIVIPVSKIHPELKTHEGYEWLYVLSGRMRLVLGDHDLILGPGEVAEFDTHVPHWFGSTGDQPAEVLSVFGGQGERMLVRAKSAGKKSQ